MVNSKDSALVVFRVRVFGLGQQFCSSGLLGFRPIVLHSWSFGLVKSLVFRPTILPFSSAEGSRI